VLKSQAEDVSTLGSVKNLGKVLFTDFLFPFEIASVLLLTAMIGVVMLAKAEKKTDINIKMNDDQ
jgi:NADH-quinone oxidoreductase subunit J